MAKGYEFDVFEDDACLNCGETHFSESRLSGICSLCFEELKQDQRDLNHSSSSSKNSGNSSEEK